jgi:hypothetical protein
MAINPVDEEGRTIRLASLDPKPKPKPRDAPPDKPLDGPTTKTEVQRALSTVYNLAHKILHDEVRYLPGDFSEEADGIVELMQQHSVLRVIMRIAAPLAAFGAIYEKVEGTVVRFRERREQLRLRKRGGEAMASPPAPGATAAPSINGLTPAPGLSAEQIAKRPFGR